MKTYTVKYIANGTDEAKDFTVWAGTKAEAYDKAVDGLIGLGEAFGKVWVDGYTYLTHGGYKYHKFSTPGKKATKNGKAETIGTISGHKVDYNNGSVIIVGTTVQVHNFSSKEEALEHMRKWEGFKEA